MELEIKQSIDKLLELPEPKLKDSPGLIAEAVVKAMDSFQKINRITIANRLKPLNDSKTEEVGYELTKAFFYISCLIHLCELDQSEFDADQLHNFSYEFGDVYQQDAVLCSMNAMQQLIDLTDYVFVDDVLDLQSRVSSVESDEGEDHDDPSEEVVSEPSVDDTDDLNLSDVATTEDLRESIAICLACIIILCERFELDFETVIYNTKSIAKF